MAALTLLLTLFNVTLLLNMAKPLPCSVVASSCRRGGVLQEGWVKHLYDDWDAVVGRAKGLWAPRWRTASHGAIDAASANDNADEAAAPAAEGLTTGSRDDATTAATATNADKTAPTAGEESLVKGKVDPTSTEEDFVAPDALDVDDGWGGLGSPRPATAEGGSDVAAGGDGKLPAPGAQGGGGGVTAKNKARWVRGGWSTVDVRAVQSRLSRIVDDTSARIRSNIVVKVCRRMLRTVRLGLHLFFLEFLA